MKKPTRAKPKGITVYLDAVAGLKYYDYQRLPRFKPGMRLRLVHEPENEYDSNAIRVETPSGCKLGYIKREKTELIHTASREPKTIIQAEVVSFNQNNPSWDMLIIRVTAYRPTRSASKEHVLTVD